MYREIEARSKVDSSKTEGRCRTAEADRPSTSATSMPDHLHLCLEVHPTIALSEFVQVAKQESSRWLKEHREWFPRFDGWGNGYAAFTYSVKERPTVIEYIKNQKVHHHKATFREEYEDLLREFGLDPEKDLFLKD